MQQRTGQHTVIADRFLVSHFILTGGGNKAAIVGRQTARVCLRQTFLKVEQFATIATI
ncbi:MAG: hypothetical protein HC936_09325 [Leptolyngbyaceae cyanobacterium SU_3_3]|nr:hypothetical protein [Leptolyngbyaceae cyanobacterium SU_3_3]